MKFKAYFILLLMLCNSAFASEYSRVERDLKKHDQHIESLNKKFSTIPEDLDNIEWVKSKLDHMFEVDQYIRKQWINPIANDYSLEEKTYFNEEFTKRIVSLDRQNTADFKVLLKKYEWFKISLFGMKADNQAWLLVQHADLNIEFQKEVLKVLEKLYPVKETKPANYAYLFDRVATSSNDPSLRVPQRYGTQGRCVGPAEWQPWPIEDEANVDLRRKDMGLNSMAEYKAVFKDICH